MNYLEKSTSASPLQKAGAKGLAKGLERVEGLDAADKEKLKAIATESDTDAPKAIKELKQLFLK